MHQAFSASLHTNVGTGRNKFNIPVEFKEDESLFAARPSRTIQKNKFPFIQYYKLQFDSFNEFRFRHDKLGINYDNFRSTINVVYFNFPPGRT